MDRKLLTLGGIASVVSAFIIVYFFLKGAFK